MTESVIGSCRWNVVPWPPFVVMIPKFVVDEAIFQGFDSVRAKDLVGDVLEQYRLLSRYPAGMSPATLHILLAECGQRELKIVTP